MSETTSKIKLTLDLRFVCLLLAVVIAVMLGLWRPWSHTAVSRKITVDGTATVKSAPDEYQFSPYFQLQGSDHQATITKLAAKATEAVNALKQLGVQDKQIRLDTSFYNSYWQPDGDNTLTASLTITVTDKALAQKVQDYLTASDAMGSLSPYPTFSETKRKSLEADARGQAITDARKKGEQSASQLGAKLGSVIEVKDNTTGSVMPMVYGGAAVATDSVKATSVPLLSGEQEVTVGVEVVYTLR